MNGSIGPWRGWQLVVSVAFAHIVGDFRDYMEKFDN